MGGVNAVEDAIELGTGEAVIEEGVVFGLDFGELGWRGERVFFVGVGGLEIGRELGAGAGKGATERVIDGAELGGLEIVVVSADSFVDVGDADVKLLDEVGTASTGVVNKNANADEGDGGDDAADENFENETIGDFRKELRRGFAGFGLASGARLGNLVEILELIHDFIIA